MVASSPEADASIRAFVGLELDRATRAGLARLIRELAAHPWARGVRWVDEASLHLTLRFLGKVESGAVAGIVDALVAGLAEFEPFELALADPMLFPTARRPHVIAVGLRSQTETVALAGAVERAVVAAGLPPEPRPFRAHVTLGRFRRPPRRLLDPTREVAALRSSCPVTEVQLFRSHLGSSGARYEVLERIPLGSRAPGSGGDRP